MKRLIQINYFVLVMLFLNSCSMNDQAEILGMGGGASSAESAYTDQGYLEEYEMDDMAKKSEYAEENLEQDTDLDVDEPISKKIIKTGDVSLEVEDYKAEVERVRSELNRWGAYVSSENEVNNSYRTGNSLVIRVRSENFDSLMNGIISGEGKVVSKSVNLLDVTEEFVDIQARLKTKREVEQRYREILKQARSIEEILRVEDKIGRVREEIEAKEGRLKYLKDRVSYSTINLDIYSYYDDIYEPGFLSKIGDAFTAGWEGIKVFFVVVLYLWPLWLIGIIVWILIRRAVRKRRKVRES